MWLLESSQKINSTLRLDAALHSLCGAWTSLSFFSILLYLVKYNDDQYVNFAVCVVFRIKIVMKTLSKLK